MTAGQAPSRRARTREPDAAALAVRAAAAAAADWPSLREPALRCVACPELVASRRSVVFGQFPPGADIALLGEAPGAEEDATGEPFVGRSGQLLDRLLAEAGLPREQVAVVNVLKCRPPGNRRPQPVEAVRCRGWLDRQLGLIDPLVVVALGGTATEAMLGRGAKVTRVRGRDRIAGGRLVIASYHPSAALRFGPRGEPLAMLAADLAHVAASARRLRGAGVRLTAAGPEDAADVLAVTALAYGTLPPLDPPTGALAEGLDTVAADLAHGGVVARAGGRVVGALRFRPGDEPSARWIRRIAVHPDARGRGVGGVLVRWAEAIAATDGCTEMRIGVRAQLPANRAWYERGGYRWVADHAHGTGDRPTWSELRKELG
ncbi:MAG: GNAT family N-acetyltransferase [Frankiaceae bacterium]